MSGAMRRFYSNGFALPIVLVLSLAATISALAVLQSVSSTKIDTVDIRYTKMAELAAEAGAVYASSCLEKSFHQLTWGSANGGAPLTQSTDCTGTVNGTYPTHLMPNTAGSRVRTSFMVGEPESLSANSVRIRSVGTAEYLNGSGTTISTFTAFVKKTTVWNPELAVQQSSSGIGRTCGLLSSNVYCWGTNADGELGDGTYTASLTPVAVKRQAYGASGIGNHAVVAISSAGSSNCMAIDTGEVYCWGTNDKGELGIGSASPIRSNVPLRVSGLPVSGDKVVKLSLTNGAACALTEGGNLYCWGSNAQGAVGNNSTTDRLSPVLIGGTLSGGFGALAGQQVASLSSSGGLHYHMCAVGTNGLAYCWGDNRHGQLGDGTVTTPRRTPVAVNTAGVLSGKTVTKIATDGDYTTSSTSPAYSHTCAVAYTTTAADAKVYCWGSNSVGALGVNASPATCPTANNSTCRSSVAVAVNTSGVLSGKTITEVSASKWGSCVIGYTPPTTTATAVYCWGQDTTLGNGAASGTTPLAVAATATQFGGGSVDQLIGGAGRMCVRANNKAYCWGNNGNGQIGDGTTILRRTPTEALFLRPNDNQYLY